MPFEAKWRVLIACVVSFSVINAFRLVLSPILEPVRLEFRLSYLELSYLGSAYDLGCAAGLWSSLLLTRANKAKVIVRSVALISAMSLVGGVTISYWALLLSRALAGVGYGMFIIFGSLIIADYFPGGERGRALGFWGSGASIGRMYGAILGGSVTTILGWRWAFNAVFIIAAFASFFAWLGLSPSKGYFAVSGSMQGLRMFLQKRFILVTFAYSVSTGLFVASLTFIPLYLAGLVGYPTQTVGLLLAVTTLVTILANPFLGHLADRYGEKNVAILILALGAALLTILPHLTGWLELVLYSLAFGLVITSTITIYISYATMITIPAFRSAILAVYHAVAVTFSFLTTVLFGYIADLLGLQAVFYGLAILVLSATLASLSMKSHFA